MNIGEVVSLEAFEHLRGDIAERLEMAEDYRALITFNNRREGLDEQLLMTLRMAAEIKNDHYFFLGINVPPRIHYLGEGSLLAGHFSHPLQWHEEGYDAAIRIPLTNYESKDDTFLSSVKEVTDKFQSFNGLKVYYREVYNILEISPTEYMKNSRHFNEIVPHVKALANDIYAELDARGLVRQYGRELHPTLSTVVQFKR